MTRRRNRGNTYGKDITQQETLYPVSCKWCGRKQWSTDKRKQFCDDPNHRVYYSKAKTRAMLGLWTWWLRDRITPIIDDNDATYLRDTNRKEFNKTVEHLATNLGLRYDDEKREYVRAN